jgi:putative transcriptional regulator
MVFYSRHSAVSAYGFFSPAFSLAVLSAMTRSDMSKTTIEGIQPDAAVVESLESGSERLLPTPAMPLAEAEIHAAAVSALAGPAVPEEVKARLVPSVKTLRRTLGLTQEEFAMRYRIPLGTLRDWEQGRTQPDQPARAYIKVIAIDPDWVSRALASAQ